jgi:hypothetical protein
MVVFLLYTTKWRYKGLTGGVAGKSRIPPVKAALWIEGWWEVNKNVNGRPNSRIDDLCQGAYVEQPRKGVA